MENIHDIEHQLKQQGISQTQLASLLETNLTTVNNWFRRGRIPTKYQEQLLEVLGLESRVTPIDTLFETSTKAHVPVEEIKSIKRATETTKIDRQIDITHIEPSKGDYFTLDRRLLQDRASHTMAFNTFMHQNSEQIHIIDKTIHKYCGDGIYYVQYPHEIIFVELSYNPQMESYLINPLLNPLKHYQVTQLSLPIIGKVIYAITSL